MVVGYYYSYGKHHIFVTSYLRTYNGKRLMSVLAIRLPVVKNWYRI